MDNHDPYVILGIRRDATNEEIADAYRELLSICFGRDVSQFRRIVRAYLQLCGMGPDDAWSSPTPILTNSFRWFRSNRLRIICFIGGSVLFGVIAYKAFQLSKITQSPTLTDLENSSSQVTKAPITIILEAWQWSEKTTTSVAQWIQNRNGVGESRASIPSHCLLTGSSLTAFINKHRDGQSSNAIVSTSTIGAWQWSEKTTTSVSQWIIENPPFQNGDEVGESRASIPSHCLVTGSSLTALVNKYGDGQSSNAIASTSTIGAWQWSEKTTTLIPQRIIENPPFQNEDEVGESRASIPSHCLVTGSSLTALVNKYGDGQSSNAIASTPTTDGQSSNEISTTVSSISSSTFGVCSKALKWTAESVGSAWKWNVDKVTSNIGDEQSSNEIGSTVSSISGSTFEATSKVLKWTAGSVGSAWKWTVGKVTSTTGDEQSSNEIGTTVSSISSSTFGVCSKALKWTAGSVGSAWKWSVDKVTYPTEDGQSSNEISSTVSSTTTSTLGACSKALKWGVESAY
ncbi:hypothetical protein KR215_010753 [Drosophila sulfurigaster]|nr:hypothetical protein KR215_010753 [Drosophila sulfurigaster]